MTGVSYKSTISNHKILKFTIMKNVTVFNTQSNTPSSFTTEATTYGEIKHLIPGADSMKVVVRETKVTLENDDALLPEGDFTLFLFPEKVKSGAIDTDNYDADDEGLLAALGDIDENIDDVQSYLSAKLDRVLAKIDELTRTLHMSPEDRLLEAQKEAEKQAAIKALAEEAASMRF
jgi:hypothetical protein